MTDAILKKLSGIRGIALTLRYSLGNAGTPSCQLEIDQEIILSLEQALKIALKVVDEIYSDDERGLRPSEEEMLEQIAEILGAEK